VRGREKTYRKREKEMESRPVSWDFLPAFWVEVKKKGGKGP